LALHRRGGMALWTPAGTVSWAAAFHGGTRLLQVGQHVWAPLGNPSMQPDLFALLDKILLIFLDGYRVLAHAVLDQFLIKAAPQAQVLSGAGHILTCCCLQDPECLSGVGEVAGVVARGGSRYRTAGLPLVSWTKPRALKQDASQTAGLAWAEMVACASAGAA